jgi:flagellar protein FlaG
MDINVSQVGQDFAMPAVDIVPDNTRTNRSTEESLADVRQQTKDLSVSAEIKEQDFFDISAEQIESAVSQLSEFVQTNNKQLNFSVDEGSDKQVVKVIDTESGEVIRQIPTEEVLKLSERLQDLQVEVGTAVGLLFNKQV